MNTPEVDAVLSDAIEPELVLAVVRVMKEQHVSATLAVSLVITSDPKRCFGNAMAVAKLAQQMFDRSPSTTRRGTPRPYSHSEASHRALEEMAAA